MAVTDTIIVNHILEDPETGAMEIELNWNGSIYPQVFSSRAEISQRFGGAIDSPDQMARVFFNWWLARSPDASNQALVEGKTFEVDFSDPNPVKVHN